MPEKKALHVTKEMGLLFEAYTDAELGVLIQAAMKYIETGEEPEFLSFRPSEFPQNYVWHAMKKMIDDNEAK